MYYKLFIDLVKQLLTRFKSRGFTINKKVWSFMFYIKSAHKRFR